MRLEYPIPNAVHQPEDVGGGGTIAVDDEVGVPLADDRAALALALVGRKLSRGRGKAIGTATRPTATAAAAAARGRKSTANKVRMRTIYAPYFNFPSLLGRGKGEGFQVS